MALTFGSLFAGIGGFDLGFERAGMECRWQVEIDPFCQKVLAKHWPDVRRYSDVRECGSHNLEPVDVICGGFPCQDISNSSSTKTGIEGSRLRGFRPGSARAFSGRATGLRRPFVETWKLKKNSLIRASLSIKTVQTMGSASWIARFRLLLMCSLFLQT